MHSEHPPGACLACSYSRPAPEGGFSLIELLAVIAILVIVFTIFWGPNPEQKKQARLSACRTNLEKMYMAMEIYTREYSERFPSRPTARSAEEALAPLVPRFTVDTAVFLCPGATDRPPGPDTSFEQGTISYAYYMGRTAKSPGEPLVSDRQINTTAKAAGEPVFSSTGKPPGNNHGSSGGNILFCDGRVETVAARVPFALGLAQGIVLLNPKHE